MNSKSNTKTESFRLNFSVRRFSTRHGDGFEVYLSLSLRATSFADVRKSQCVQLLRRFSGQKPKSISEGRVVGGAF